jgi:hypothetical protein
LNPVAAPTGAGPAVEGGEGVETSAALDQRSKDEDRGELLNPQIVQIVFPFNDAGPARGGSNLSVPLQPGADRVPGRRRDRRYPKAAEAKAGGAHDDSRGDVLLDRGKRAGQSAADEDGRPPGGGVSLFSYCRSGRRLLRLGLSHLEAARFSTTVASRLLVIGGRRGAMSAFPSSRPSSSGRCRRRR